MAESPSKATPDQTACLNTCPEEEVELNKLGFPVMCEPAVGQVIAACNKVLTDAELYLNSQGEVIAKQQEIINDINSELSSRMDQIEDMKRRDKVWYKNPVYVGVLGFLSGAVALSVIQSR